MSSMSSFLSLAPPLVARVGRERAPLAAGALALPFPLGDDVVVEVVLGAFLVFVAFGVEVGVVDGVVFFLSVAGDEVVLEGAFLPLVAAALGLALERDAVFVGGATGSDSSARGSSSASLFVVGATSTSSCFPSSTSLSSASLLELVSATGSGSIELPSSSS